MSGLFDQTYQPWEGRLQARPMRVFAIMLAGMTNTWRRNWIALTICCGLQALISVLIGVLISTANLGPELSLIEVLKQAILWTSLLVVPVVGSGLVASDVKHNALLMYFSKSIHKVDYILGKVLAACGILSGPLFLAPALVAGLILYGMGPAATTAYSSRLILALLGCVLIALVPTVTVILAFSSCTKRGFLAGIGWVVLYLMLEMTSAILRGVHLKWGYLLSVNTNVVVVARQLLPAPPAGLPTNPVAGMVERELSFAYSPWVSVLILAAVAAASLGVVAWRISNAERRG